MKNRFTHFILSAAKSLQSCPTLCDPIDSSPPGFPVPGILQARTLEWVAISFSNACKWKVKVKSLSRVRLLVTPWTAAYQTPPSMGFSRQEYWSGVPLPSPHILRTVFMVFTFFVYRKSWLPSSIYDQLYWNCASLSQAVLSSHFRRERALSPESTPQRADLLTDCVTYTRSLTVWPQ